MKNKIKNFTIMIVIFTILVFCILNNDYIKNNMLVTMENYYKYLLPSLIMFILLGELLTNYGFIELLNILFNPLLRLFKISSNQLYILIMSILCGCPSNAKYTVDLYKKNYISFKEANKILIYSYFSNIIYMITILYSLLNNTKYILFIFISHYCSNIILLFIFKEKKTYIKRYDLKNILSEKKDFTYILLNSIKNTLKICLNTLIIICFFSIIVSIIKITIGDNILLIGLIEITNGMYELNNISNELIKAIFILIFLSFGGISIHFQIKSVLKDTNIKYINFLVGRILQSILSIFIFIFLIYYFK